MRIRVEQLTHEAFAPFGRVLGEPAGQPNIRDEVSDAWIGYTDLMGIGKADGKQVTFLKIHTRPAQFAVLERHLTTAEAFIPLEGRSILVVVAADQLGGDGKPDVTLAKAFLMDGSKGVVFDRGTWHAVPYNLTDIATYLVLVDEGILAKDDIHKVPIEPIEFDVARDEG